MTAPHTATSTAPLPVSGAVLAGGSAGGYSARLPVDALALTGHYPGYPIVPGVFLTEIVTAAEAAHRGLPDLHGRWTGVRSVRFRAPVFPGQQVTLQRAADRPRWTVTHEDGTDVAVVDLVVDDAAAPAAVVAAAPAAVPAGPGTFPQPAQILPHRPPMLLVDTVLAVEPGASATVGYTVTPGAGGADTGATDPVPWPLIVESWGQAAALLALWEEPSPDVRTGNVLLFGGARAVTFGAAPLPGASLVHRVELLADAGGATLLTGSSWVGDTQVLEVGQVTLGRRPPGSLPDPHHHTGGTA